MDVFTDPNVHDDIPIFPQYSTNPSPYSFSQVPSRLPLTEQSFNQRITPQNPNTLIGRPSDENAFGPLPLQQSADQEIDTCNSGTLLRESGDEETSVSWSIWTTDSDWQSGDSAQVLPPVDSSSSNEVNISKEVNISNEVNIYEPLRQVKEWNLAHGAQVNGLSSSSGEGNIVHDPSVLPLVGASLPIDEHIPDTLPARKRIKVVDTRASPVVDPSLRGERLSDASSGKRRASQTNAYDFRAPLYVCPSLLSVETTFQPLPSDDTDWFPAGDMGGIFDQSYSTILAQSNAEAAVSVDNGPVNGPNMDMGPPAGKRVTATPRPFACAHDGCDKTFTSNQSSSVHYRHVHHGETMPCLNCGEKFSHPSNLNRHKKTCGRKLFTYECPVCKKRNARHDNMKRHWRTSCKEMLTLYPGFVDPETGKMRGDFFPEGFSGGPGGMDKAKVYL